MRRLLATALVAVWLVGCHAPTPSMNSLVPYGKATVPAPATGAVGTSTDYYSVPTPPPPGGAPATVPGAPGGLPPGAPAETAPGSFMGTNAMTDSAVVPASYTPGTTAGSRSGSSTVSPRSSSTLKLNGMPLNDATAVSSPQALPAARPVNLTQLPDASHAPSFLRILSPSSSSTTVPVAPAVAPTTVAASANTGSGSWQTR